MIHQFHPASKWSNFHWEVTDCPDGLDNVEVRYIQDGKIWSRVSIPFEIVDKVIEKMLEVRNECKNQ